jgi:hypothetical protein
MVLGYEYDFSCWVRGNNVQPTAPGGAWSYNYMGFWDLNRPNGGWGATVPSYPVVSSIASVAWQKIGGAFVWDGCEWNGGQVSNEWQFNFICQDKFTELDVDDFYLGCARGTIQQISPIRY